MSALVADATTVAGPDGTAALLCGEPAATGAVAAALATRGCRTLASGSTAVDPETLEVSGVEVVLLLVLAQQADGTAVRSMSGGEAAYALGSRSARLSEVEGGPLPALARVSRRVRGYQLAYADPDVAAGEVIRLWG